MSTIRKIERISTSVAEKITTAQVVVSLSSALRQLIDNSIDAGATIIDIRAKNNGFDSVEVQDNGDGIDEHNFDALCKPHSTSKLSSFSDFDQLSTLGFRGEALNALCALSKVTIFTRTSKVELGHRLVFDHSGNIIEKSNAAREVGTTITVENLFETLPVRRKELERTAKRDFSKFLATVQSFSLMCPQIKFLCTNSINNKRQILICTPGGASSVQDVVTNLFGVSAEKDHKILIKIREEKPNEEIMMIHHVPSSEQHIFELIRISGFISNCEHGCGRSTSDRQFIYINNRPVDYSRVSSLINEVYKQFNKAQYPILVVFIQVPTDRIDVNVTPDKKTVMFEKEKHLLAILRASILATFQPILGAHSTAKSSVEDRRNLSFYSSANSTLDESTILETSTLSSTADDSLSNEDVFRTRRRASIREPTPKRFCAEKSSKPITLDQFSFKFTPCEKSKENMEIDEAVRKLTPPLLRNLSRGFDSSSIRDDPILDKVVEQLKLEEEKEEAEEDLESVASQEIEIIQNLNQYDEKNETMDSFYIRPQQNVNFSFQKLRKRFEKLLDDDDQQSVSSSSSLEFTSRIRPEDNEEAERQLTRALKKEDFSKMKVIGQFNKGFIICILRNHLFIIDQHASDEKYNFEKLQMRAKLTKQPLFRPSALNFGTVQEMIIRENLHIFHANGFDFEFRENEGCVKAFMTARPEILSQNLTNSDVDEIVAMVTEYPNQMYRPSKIRKIFASRACRKSIMIGKSLNVKEMTKVVGNLANLDQPWNCPHGRPTIRHLVTL